MKVSEALLQRRSTRAFLPKPVEQETLQQVLNYARWAPSGVNMQPWQVYVLSGQAKQSLSQALLEAFESGQKEPMDYQYYPKEWVEPFKSRRIALGQQLYEHLEIDHSDKPARLAQWGRNYIGFDAPVLMIFTIEQTLAEGSFIDYGMFLQSVMLMAEELGLATCPQASLAEYPILLREILNLEKTQRILCGISIGYADKNALANQFQPERESVETFAKFIDTL